MALSARILKLNRRAFTVIELVLVVGIIGTVATIIIASVNPAANFEAAEESKQKSDAKQLQNALTQYQIDNGTLPNEAEIPEDGEDSMPICKQGVSGDDTCVVLDALVPAYIPGIPVNDAETAANYSGYEIHADPESIGATITYVESGSASSSSSSVSTITSGLIAHWKLDEAATGGADSVVDSGPNSLHGTPFGAGGAQNLPQPNASVPATLAISPRSLNFDGTDDYVRILDANPLDITTAFSLSLWFSAANLTQTNRYLLSKLTSANNDNAYAMIYEYSNNQVQFYVTGSPVGYASANTNLPINDTQWHHLVYTYDGATFRGYIDGVSAFTPVNVVFSLTATTGNLMLGSFNGSGYFSGGSLDDVRIYNRFLTPAEVAQMAAGNG